MDDAKRYPREKVLEVAQEIYSNMKPFCERVKVVGSLRRRKKFVKDCEILFIGSKGKIKDDLFEEREVNLGLEEIDYLVKRGLIAKRPNINGHLMWGEKNRYAQHVRTGIPIDFFAVPSEPCPLCHDNARPNNPSRTSEQEALQTTLRPLRKAIPKPQSENLQQGLRDEAPMGRGQNPEEGQALSTDGLQDLPQALPKQELLEKSQGVLTEMRPPIQSAGNASPAEMDGGQRLQNQRRLHNGLQSENSAKREEERSNIPTSTCDAATLGEAVEARGMRSPPQRSQTRQQDRESGSSNPKVPHGEGDLPALPNDICNKVVRPKCSMCGGTGLVAPAWFNYLVCRTGGQKNNTLLAEAYRRKGYRWAPYEAGFYGAGGVLHENRSEEDVYRNAGLRYLPPDERP